MPIRHKLVIEQPEYSLLNTYHRILEIENRRVSAFLRQKNNFHGSTYHTSRTYCTTKAEQMEMPAYKIILY